jgi:uncharacterized membrane protein HdeD (DUF308 family)
MNSLKEIIKKIKVQRLVSALVIAIIGILFIVFPNDSARILCYTGGSILIVWGIFRIVMYFLYGLRTVNYSLVGGGALVAIGVMLCCYPDLIADILTIALGIVLIIDGIIKLQQCINIVIMKDKNWWISLIVCIISIVLGIVALCNPFSSRTALMIYIGISLIVDAICDIVSAYRLGAAERKASKNVIDID